MKKLAVVLQFVFFTFTSFAQRTAELSSSEILLSFNKLNTLGGVLYIAAHPDDENTRLLAYLAKEKNLRTGYLSLTRGDGGQNLIGKEQGEELGMIRTQELLAARRNDGAEQFFTRANDFGYSKNPEETFAIWNKDSILSDMVWVIRNFKPDILICRFPTTGEGGHGHHTASAILAVEAYEAAADPSRFPQQLKYTQPWQVKRVLWNTFNFGGNNTTAPDQLKIDIGTYNPLLGKGYGEIAAESRSMHKSQGFGSARTRGTLIEYFKTLKGVEPKLDLFEGIDQTWNRIGAAKKVAPLITELIRTYNPALPEKSIPALIKIYRQIQLLDSNDPVVKYWKDLKLSEIESLLLACSGLWLEPTLAEATCIPGVGFQLTTQVVNRSNTDTKLNSISYFQRSDTLVGLKLKQNESYLFSHKDSIPSTATFSTPYWLEKPHTSGLFVINDQRMIGRPENDYPLKVMYDLTILDLNLKLERGVLYKYTDPVKGEVYKPLEIVPPATINISNEVFVFADLSPKTIQFTVKANAANVIGTLKTKISEGWKLEIKNPDFKLAMKGDEAIIEATLTPLSLMAGGSLEASVQIKNNQYDKSIKRIEYDHIPYQFILSKAQAALVMVDLKKAGTNIGYIAGPGDEVAECLKQIGYKVTLLNDDLLKGDLSRYDAIVTGVRAYNTNKLLQVYHSKLLDYVSNGGNLIVQYNTNSRVGPLTVLIGPKKFTISRDRVTDENAEVRILKPAHPIVNYPNSITTKDFEGWIQERGIYFATELDSTYQTIFSMNDPKEKPSEGSLIYTPWGKGNFVYTGIAFFRELPAGVPGAYRLFVNMLSIPKQK